MTDAPRRITVSPAPEHRRLLLAALLVGVAALLLWWLWPRSEPAAPPPERLPLGEFRPTPQQWGNLGFAVAGAGAFADTITTDGQIATDDDRTTQFFSPFSGRITQIFVRPGDRVGSGQPIYAVAASELVQGRSDVATALATLAGAQKALGTAQANAERQRALFRIEGAAQRDVQQAESDLAAARTNVLSAQAQLAAARSRLSILGLSPGAATGRGDVATVRSPIAGTVISRAAGIGQYVESAATGAANPLFVISDLSRVWLVANVRETDAPKLRSGTALQVQVPAYPGQTFTGRVYYVSPAVDPNTRRIAVRAEIANPGELLRPNMFATARLVGAANAPAVRIPSDAILYEGDSAHVWVAHPERKTLSLRAIKAGTDQDGLTTVVAGLQPGERIVTRGSVFIDRANGSAQ